MQFVGSDVATLGQHLLLLAVDVLHRLGLHFDARLRLEELLLTAAHVDVVTVHVLQVDATLAQVGRRPLSVSILTELIHHLYLPVLLSLFVPDHLLVVLQQLVGLLPRLRLVVGTLVVRKVASLLGPALLPRVFTWCLVRNAQDRHHESLREVLRLRHISVLLVV